ncbi:MAG: hypothetical protein K2X47_00975, partial [Bdellovibrionales bacterium]|nr:hypothetical protein [Bdellovibrionales bacterium]
RGAGLTSALSASLILLLEPVIASGISFFVWKEPISHFFLLGACFVLAAGSPLDLPKLLKAFTSARRLQLVRTAASTLIGLLVVLLPLRLLGLESAKIRLIEIVPNNPSDYTASDELRQIGAAADLAQADYLLKNKKCESRIEKTLKRGSEDELFQLIRNMSKEPTSQRNIIVGLSRTNFARLGAKAASGSGISGISVGAATANLVEINSNFMSMVSPWTKQWDAIYSEMQKLGCNGSTTAGYFDTKDYLSNNFRQAFLEAFANSEIQTVPTPFKANKDVRCVYLAVNFSQAEQSLRDLSVNSERINVFGVGDWNYNSRELEKLLRSLPKNLLNVVAPTGWVPGISKNSELFQDRIQKATGLKPVPLAAYTYDGVTVAFNVACGNTRLSELTSTSLGALSLLRTYEGIAPSRNLLSPMHLIKFGKDIK